MYGFNDVGGRSPSQVDLTLDLKSELCNQGCSYPPVTAE